MRRIQAAKNNARGIVEVTKVNKRQRKVVKLVDNRGCTSTTVQELKQAIAGIKAGEVVGVSITFTRRDGSVRSYSDSDCAIRALGAVDLLREHIITTKFKQL